VFETVLFNKKQTSEMSSVDQHAIDAAYQGRVDDAKAHVAGGVSVNCVVMGASRYIDDVKEGLVEKDEQRLKATKVLAQWAIDQGACFPFAFKQPPASASVQVMKYNKNISMRSGPGDVARAPFPVASLIHNKLSDSLFY